MQEVKCAGNLPDGCVDPSDLDYYERVNGPDEDPQDEDDESDLPPECELDEDYEAWLDEVYKQDDRFYQDACRVAS